MADIINRVLPILVLLGVGAWMRRTQFITEGVVAGLRKIVINLSLPAVLFLAFLEIEFKASDVLIIAVTIVIPVGLYFVGKALQLRVGRGHNYFPLLMTGFEAGMLGIGLFGTAYGLDRIVHFAVVDLGHELFIWFVFLALLLAKRDGAQDPRGLVSAFFRSPVIIAILAGIGANLVGIGSSLDEWPLVGGLIATMALVAPLTSPMILLIVGYGVHLSGSGVREAMVPVATRLAVALPLAIFLPLLLMGSTLDNDPYSQAALFTLLILPPPFIIPLYMRDDDDERSYVNNVLSLYTLFSIAVFVAYVAANPL